MEDGRPCPSFASTAEHPWPDSLGRLSPLGQSVCLVMFSRTPTQASVTNSDEPP
jgi:hypothetical protein